GRGYLSTFVQGTLWHESASIQDPTLTPTPLPVGEGLKQEREKRTEAIKPIVLVGPGGGRSGYSAADFHRLRCCSNSRRVSSCSSVLFSDSTSARIFGLPPVCSIHSSRMKRSAITGRRPRFSQFAMLCSS